MMDLEEHTKTIKFLARDRDAKFVAGFDAVVQCTGRDRLSGILHGHAQVA